MNTAEIERLLGVYAYLPTDGFIAKAVAEFQTSARVRRLTAMVMALSSKKPPKLTRPRATR